MAGFGDSIQAYPRVVCPQLGCGWFELAGAALRSSNPGRGLTYNNHAVGGEKQAVSYATAQTWIAAGGIQFLVWKSWSQNDGGTATDINADFNTYVPLIIALAHASGAIPVLLTSIPTSKVTTCVDDTARINTNTALLAMASATVIVADMDPAMSAGGCPATLIPAFTPDGQHPNAAGAAAMAPVLQNAVQAWLTAHP